jgi:hypothetical protein
MLDSDLTEMIPVLAYMYTSLPTYILSFGSAST